MISAEKTNNTQSAGIFLAIVAAVFLMTVLVGGWLSQPVEAASPSDFNLKEGDLISAFNFAGDVDVYIVNIHGFKRVIVKPDIFNFYSHLSFDKIKQVTMQTRDAFSNADLYRNCETNDQRVFALEARGEDAAVIHHVNMTGAQAVAQDANFFKKVFCINTREFNSYTIGTDYTSVSQIPTYSRGVGGGPILIPPTPTPTVSPSPTVSPTPSVTPVIGGVNFSVASDTPVTATIPKGATAVSFLKFNISNTNSIPVTITTVTVKRTGPGLASDFSNVYLFNGSERLTFGRTFNSSANEAVFTGLKTPVSANGSLALSVLADVSTSASTGDVHAFAVTSLTASSFTATGNAIGNNMTIAGVSAGTVTIARTGTLTNPQIGAQDAEIVQFQLIAGSSENLKVERITLTNAGNISNSNLTDLKLKDRSTSQVVATSGGFDSQNRAVFIFTTPMPIDMGNTKTMSITADIGSATRSGDTSRIYLENSADLLAVGQTLGFGTTVTNTDYDNSSNNGTDASWVVVAPGQITISFNGPASKDIAKNNQDVEIFNFTVTPQVNAEIRQIKFSFDGGSGTADFIGAGNVVNYRDVKVADANTGSVIWGPTDFSGTDGGAGDISQTLTFTGTTNLTAGQPRTFKVTTDVANSADVTSGDTIRAVLDVTGFNNQIRNTDNNTFVATADIVPASNIFGNTMTVRIPSLSVTLATVPTSQTFVKGTNDMPFVGFNLAAGTAGEARVSSIRVTCYIDADGASDFVKGEDADASGTVNCLETVPTIRLKVDGAQVGDNKSVGTSTDGTATFSNLNLTIPAGQTKVVQVFADISSSAFRNSNAERISFDIDSASSDIAVSDQSGNPVIATGDDPNGATSPLRIVTISSAGTLTVASAPTEIDMTDSRIVSVGSTDTTLAKIRFTAQNEELKLTKARILIDSLVANADVSDDITSVSLWDGTVKVAGPVSLTPVSAAGTVDAFADFNVISPNFVIPKDGNRTLTVSATLNSISGGADSGDEFRVTLDFDDNFEVRGTSSSTVITSAGAANTNGNYVVLRKSQPKVNLATLPTTTLSNGNQVLMKFSVQANNGDVALKHLVFDTQSSDATVVLSNVSIRESGTSSDISATVSAPAAGGGTLKVTFTSEQQVISGGTKTYELRADVTGVGASDTLTTRILGDTAIVTGELGPMSAAQQVDDLDDILNVGNDTDNDGEYNFIWSDMSAIPHNDMAATVDDVDEGGANDWTNARHIRLIPSDTQTLVFPS